MRTLNPLKLIGTLDAILPAVQQVIGAVLPDFLHENLNDPEVRNQIVLVADQVLPPVPDEEDEQALQAAVEVAELGRPASGPLPA